MALGKRERFLPPSLLSLSPSPPVKESLAPEHSCELLGDSLPDILDRGGVAHEGSGHLKEGGREGGRGEEKDGEEV